ncbi:MAG: histidinol dehydrogenase [Candidatus Omnitrophota bacterium]|nr:MAG: histidinol dehydrogenase [Candidatus Omnitrophota bacterium]
MKVIKAAGRKMQKILERDISSKKRVQEKVRRIIEDVRTSGDEAVLKYTRKFDRVKLSARHLRVSETEISAAYQNINPQFVSTLKTIIDNVSKFYTRQLKRSWKIKGEEGTSLGEKITPLEKVGIYVPAGTVPLISTVYMTVIPAKIAGVKEIILTAPPNKYGTVDPYILVVANLLKVDKIYKVGGAQAIAALAFGTKSLPRVDKIVGPGNVYVSEAKRQVFGYVDVDMLAGPSEIVILANDFSHPDFIACDLEAQLEHLAGLAILVTTSKRLAQAMKKRVSDGYIILAKNLDEAAEIVNRIAPEHLEIMVKNPRKILKRIKNAGAIFLGPYSPVALGDYAAGPSHVLPTAGTARFSSGLSINDFMKRSHVISYTKKALEKLRGPIEKIAELERLDKHIQSIKVRFE